MADLERMYIDGEWILAEGGATFDVKNPADGSVVARVANAAEPEIQRAVNAAHAAFREWSVLPPKRPREHAPQGPGAYAGAARRASRGS